MIGLIILGVLILLAAAGTAVLIILTCQKKKQTPTQLERKASPEEDVIVKGIRNHAADYDGLYESLYQAAYNQSEVCTDAYQEWCDRTGQSSDTPFRDAFCACFQKEDIRNSGLCVQKHKHLLELISRAGIQRDRNTGDTCIADEQVCGCYIDIMGQKPSTNQEYKIIKAAWTRDEKVIEYGMVMLRNQ